MHLSIQISSFGLRSNIKSGSGVIIAKIVIISDQLKTSDYRSLDKLPGGRTRRKWVSRTFVPHCLAFTNKYMSPEYASSTVLHSNIYWGLNLDDKNSSELYAIFLRRSAHLTTS